MIEWLRKKFTWKVIHSEIAYFIYCDKAFKEHRTYINYFIMENGLGRRKIIGQGRDWKYHKMYYMLKCRFKVR